MKFIHDLSNFYKIEVWKIGYDKVVTQLRNTRGYEPETLAEVVIDGLNKKIRVTPNHPNIKVIVDGHEVNQRPQGEGEECVICEKEIKKGDGYRIDYMHYNCSSQKDSEVAQTLISYISDLNSYFGVNNLPKGLTKSFLTKLEALAMSHINLEHGTLNEDISRMISLFGEVEGEE